MIRKNKTSIGSLIVAAAAAYGIYKLSQMSASDRNDLLAKGKKLLSDNLGGLSGLLGRADGRSEAYSDGTYTEHSYS